MQYYTELTKCTGIDNPEVIPLLISMQWYNQRASTCAHIRVSHPDSTDLRATHYSSEFYRVLGICFDGLSNSPYRKATLWLEGKCRDKALFALVKLDVAYSWVVKSITFSPVPFDANGRPKLLYEGETQEKFLRIVGLVLNNPIGTALDNEQLIAIMESAGLHQISNGPAVFWSMIEGMEHMGLLKFLRHPKVNRKVLMTTSSFEEIFGVRLPN